MTTSFPRERVHLTMTLAIFNRYVDNVTAESKTALLFGRHGARHVGSKELMIVSLLRHNKSKRGKHAKVAGRHARPARAFF